MYRRRSPHQPSAGRPKRGPVRSGFSRNPCQFVFGHCRASATKRSTLGRFSRRWHRRNVPRPDYGCANDNRDVGTSDRLCPSVSRLRLTDGIPLPFRDTHNLRSMDGIPEETLPACLAYLHAAVDADPGAAHSHRWLHNAERFSPGSACAVLLVDQILRSPSCPFISASLMWLPHSSLSC